MNHLFQPCSKCNDLIFSHPCCCSVVAAAFLKERERELSVFNTILECDVINGNNRNTNNNNNNNTRVNNYKEIAIDMAI